MENRIKKMYTADLSAIVFFMIFLWFMLVYVGFSLNKLIANVSVKVMVLTTGTLLACYATVTLLAVVNHLRKNKLELYSEEIKYQR